MARTNSMTFDARDLDAMSFMKRLKKFKRDLVPGMTLKVYIFTDDQKIDRKVRLARIVEKYDNYVLLRDDRGFMYGPTYHKLLEWGN